MAKRYLKQDWIDQMAIRLDYNNMMDDFVGREQGITNSELENINPRAIEANQKMQKNRGQGWLGWMDLPYNQDKIVKDILDTAKIVRKKAKNFVVLGIGGSALGPMAVFQALCHLHHNQLPAKKRNAPKFFVEDNVDPERMKALLDVIDVKDTVFNVITKSGATSETMSQYLIISALLKEKLGDKAKTNIIATTSEVKGNLIKIADLEGFKTFFIPEGVGGRFSELSPVGLLPAAVLGIDIAEMLAGACYMDEKCKSNVLNKNAPLMNASLQYLANLKGKNMSVMMPYADSLKLMSDWYCQIWGESIGKEVDLNGKVVNVGQTPIKALGVTDQHSQVQLYTEGPFDKVVTFLAVDAYREEFVISDGCARFHDVSFLCGHTLNELIQAERSATEYALTTKNRLNHTIYMPEVNAFTIGQLIYYFEMETAYMGELLNIDTYNQPGVENGKIATFALLGRAGFEDKSEELKSGSPKQEKYIIK